MLQWNELRITADNKCLIIDTQVEEVHYFDNVKIDSIIVNTQDSYLPTGPNKGKNNEFVVYSPELQDADIIKDGTGRHIRLELKKPIIDISRYNMYFVYVIADVSNAPEAALAPCTCNKEIILGTVINTHFLYMYLMGSIRELLHDCIVKRHFIDRFLRIQAIEASIRSGNYPMAIKYWKKFFLKDNRIINYKSCGCNGRP